MQRKRMLWADIGMILAVVLFIALIAMYHGEDSFAPLLIAYVVALAVWAVICEVAASEVEVAQKPATSKQRHNVNGSPVTH
jgi:Na+/melibiose symporter-like transporter